MHTLPHFRPMAAADIPAVGALARRIWDIHYPALISQAQIDFMLARSYTAESLQRQVDGGQQFLLTEIDGVVAGFLSTAPLSTIADPILRGDAPGEGGYFLHKFYLDPALHGRGIGRAMFAELLRTRPEIRYLRLQVHRGNRRSWKFYQKLGFTIEREADFDIGHGFAMTDYVMEWRLPAA